MDRHFGESLSVQLDSRPVQAGHETTVSHAVLAAGSVDPNNPQFAEFAFFVPAVAVGKLARAVGSLLGVPVEPAGVSKVTLCLIQGPFATLPGGCVILCFRHVLFFFV